MLIFTFFILVIFFLQKGCEASQVCPELVIDCFVSVHPSNTSTELLLPSFPVPRSYPLPRTSSTQLSRERKAKDLLQTHWHMWAGNHSSHSKLCQKRRAPDFQVACRTIAGNGRGKDKLAFICSGCSTTHYLLSYYAPPPSFLVSGGDDLVSGEDYLLSYYAPSSMQARPFRDYIFFFHSQTTAQAHQMSDLEKALLALMKEHSKTEDSLRQTQDHLRQSNRQTQEALAKLSRHLRRPILISRTSGERVQRRAKRDAIQRGGPKYRETGSCTG